MKDLYLANTANFPRLKTDTFFVNDENRYRYTDSMDRVFRFLEDFQLLNRTLWHRFVEQFRVHSDTDNGWRGEYWGKMMRGACFVYAYTKDPTLYEILAETALEMTTVIEDCGRISSYPVEKEFNGWDIWCRKYVLLGMQYFLEICTDEALKGKLVDSMCRQLDYIMTKIGTGKITITKATTHWRGLNSSSLLEPVVRLYTLTGKQEYLDFASYIVDCGGTDVANIFELAYQNDFAPYQYPVTKAYEMISCFEGLLEYYRIAGNPKHKTAIIQFADRVLETDFTVIGSSGCTHELFDHSTVRQANTNNGNVMQETCVTVTVMKFLYQVHLLTGNAKYADAFETSLYNAYLGAVNTEKRIDPSILQAHPDWYAEPLPFDSYSPLTAGTRGNLVGGLKRMPDNHYYGCCACIGSAGIGLVPKMQLLTAKDGLVLNLYIDGTIQSLTPAGQAISLKLATEYPKGGRIVICPELAKPESFALHLRNPGWSKTTRLLLNGKPAPVTEGYLSLERVWQTGDCLELELDMRTVAISPTPYGHQILMNKSIPGANYVVPTFDREDPLARKHVALRRGPLMLAQENRLGYSVDDPAALRISSDGIVDVRFPETDTAPYPHMLEVLLPLQDGRTMTVTDYASAGKLWSEDSKMAVWMLTE